MTDSERLAQHLNRWYQLKGDVGLREAAELIRRHDLEIETAVRAERERCMNAVAATYGPWRTNWTPDENLRAWKDATIEAIQSGGGPQP